MIKEIAILAAIVIAVQATDPKCGKRVADIVFILDESGSVSNANFNLTMKFVKDLVDKFDVGAGLSRVGVELFATKARTAFNLDEKPTKKEVQDAINAIKRKTGVTYTDKALQWFMANFQSKKRTNIPMVVVIMTDGKSTNDKKMKAEAAKLHALGEEYRVFAIGVGPGADQDEIKILADNVGGKNPKQEMKATSYRELQTIAGSVAKTTCSVIDETKMKVLGKGKCSAECLKGCPAL